MSLYGVPLAASPSVKVKALVEPSDWSVVRPNIPSIGLYIA